MILAKLQTSCVNYIWGNINGITLKTKNLLLTSSHGSFLHLLTLCARNSGEFPSQRFGNANFGAFYEDPHKLLNKRSSDRWFGTMTLMWRHCNVLCNKGLFTDVLLVLKSTSTTTRVQILLFQTSCPELNIKLNEQSSLNKKIIIVTS